MKKQYEKPSISKREKLEIITAVKVISGPIVDES
jgi:hypothetical protein